MRLENKVALVTGGASGIGRAISLTFAKEGAKVAVVDINLKGAEAVAVEIRSQGGVALAVRCDVTRFNEVEATVNQVLGQFRRIDILVNDAGYWVTKPFLETPIEEWDKIVRVCYFGVLNFCRVILPHMIAQRSGKIVSISSRTAQIGNVYNSVYAGAKAGVDTFTKSIARDMGKYNITANCVAPGLTETPGARGTIQMQDLGETLKDYPLGRLGLPQDIANAALFLASPEADFISGVVLTVAGGGTSR